MKRIALFILGIATVIGLSSCTGLNQGSFNFSLDSDQEILAFQALSSVNMIDVQNEQTLSSSRISKMSDEEETSIDQIKPYLELFEQLLTQSNGLSVTTEASDLIEYETKQVFTVTDLLGEQVTYTMYYSELALTDDEDDEADETDDMDEVDEIEDDEKEYAIDGILIHGDMTYTISGKREIEEDEDKLEFTAMISETNYVTVTYKLEDEETKFAYRVYVNGELDSESTIKIEVEDNEFKIELSYLSGENSGEYEFKMEEEDGDSILKIEYQSVIDGIEAEGEAKVKVVYDELTGETYYTIIVKGADDEDEHEEQHDRDMDTDDNDDDDDEEDDDEDSEDNEETDEE